MYICVYVYTYIWVNPPYKQQNLGLNATAKPRSGRYFIHQGFIQIWIRRRDQLKFTIETRDCRPSRRA